MPSEFDLIKTYFNWQYNDADHVRYNLIKGVGDDGAIVQPPSNKQLVVTTDTLISGVHFPEQTPAHAIGYKSLAVNLSDLAAMGADPAWFTLALTLPDNNKQWLANFSSGLKSLAEKEHICLIGGDTTRGTLSISITAMGFAETQDQMLRSTAQQGDIIYVTGTLGDAAVGLALLQQRFDSLPEPELMDNKPNSQDYNRCIEKLNYPQPRNRESQLIRRYASSCLDISDGFLADLNHILQESKVGAEIDLNSIPLSDELSTISQKAALHYALTGGDDYELLFTVPKQAQKAFEQLVSTEDLNCTAVGRIDESITGMISTQKTLLNPRGYNHFQR